MDDERYGWIALKLVNGVGSVLYKRLLEEIGPPEAVFSASRKKLLAVDGIGEKTVSDILHFQLKETVVQEIEKINAHPPISLIHYFHPQYPENLKNIHDPPPFLYVMGEIWKQDTRSIGMVGTRKPTFYGKQVARDLAGELVRAAWTVVSGFAMGIDQIAHEAALNAGGRTLAVLGCGLDVNYPPGSQGLKEAVGSQGAVLSEFAMGTLPSPENFPRRNRLISGLSMGVVVIEAGEKSGSLITAHAALEQGRDVFAVPGSIHSEFSRGTHSLIKSGAKLVEKAEDILVEFESLLQTRHPGDTDSADEESLSRSESGLKDLNPDEKKIYDILSLEPVYLDEISSQSDLPCFRCADVLLRLELKGLILQLNGNQFIRNHFSRRNNE